MPEFRGREKLKNGSLHSYRVESRNDSVQIKAYVKMEVLAEACIAFRPSEHLHQIVILIERCQMVLPLLGAAGEASVKNRSNPGRGEGELFCN